MKTALLLLLILSCLLPLPARSQDRHIELDALRQQAEQGIAGAQTELGYLYHTGEGVERDYAEAVKWYRLAAEQGHPDAQYDLGVAHAFGEGVERDPARASNWYRRAAEQGHVVAAFSLGLSYLHGDGVQQDSEQAAAWFRQTAEQGYTRAQVHLASLHHTGEGVPQNYEVAAYWYQQAAERGDATAQYNLGNLYRAGRGVPRDNEEALRWFRMAAKQDYAPARGELETFHQPVAEHGQVEAGVEQPAAQQPGRVISPPLEAAESLQIETLETTENAAAVETQPATSADRPPETETAEIATDPEITGFADMTAADNKEQAAVTEETLTATEPAAASETAEVSGSDDTTGGQQTAGGIGGFFGRLFGGGESAPSEQRANNESQQLQNKPDTDAVETTAATTEGNAVISNDEWQEPVAAGPDAAAAETDTEMAPGDKSASQPEPEQQEMIAMSETPPARQDVTISTAAKQALDAENYTEALHLLQAQALNGNAAAETRLADMYFQGLGVEQNYDRALLWYRRAAKRKYADAQFNLGNMYFMGEGVLKDHDKAREWYSKAAKQGHQAAANNLANLERRVKEKQRYHPDSHAGPSAAEWESTVEEERPAAAGDTQSSRRVITPPIDSEPESAIETETDADDTAGSEAPSQPRPGLGRIVSPPIESASD
ncbi:MAG: hypothetical protein U5P41_15305 [Gammaproteobacteria bacterium]|nr:hypothetical protein [Gammaproteobacteria bacterium]